MLIKHFNDYSLSIESYNVGFEIAFVIASPSVAWMVPWNLVAICVSRRDRFLMTFLVQISWKTGMYGYIIFVVLKSVFFFIPFLSIFCLTVCYLMYRLSSSSCNYLIMPWLTMVFGSLFSHFFFLRYL